ncbi:hypothetical protein GQ600_19469 [Phytophthora cactorum]|nr:hypothetical protein GQ600_19469 [Phytophthora cactorum]
MRLDECYRYYDNVNNVWSDTSSCKDEPFDVSFWLKHDLDFGYAFGYAWGQEPWHRAAGFLYAESEAK